MATARNASLLIHCLNLSDELYEIGDETSQEHYDFKTFLMNSGDEELEGVAFEMEEWIDRLRANRARTQPSSNRKILLSLLLAITVGCIGINVTSNMLNPVLNSTVQSNN